MGLTGRIVGLSAGVAGLAAAGTAVGLARRRRVIARRGVGEATPFGSLRSDPLVVFADDGVPLHVEVDEVLVGGETTTRQRSWRRGRADQLTIVFAHGYALNLDCWHFQRAGYRGLIRTVYYDQRSHGRSGRSTEGNATIDQLGADLHAVLEHVAPDGPVVLVGHSMGGMTIIALAEQYPELFGDRVVGVGLLSTTAGGLKPHRIMLPMLPRTLVDSLAQRAVAALARGHRQVDGLRRIGRDVAMVMTDTLAFGDDVPSDYVRFVDEMLSATPFEVVAEFFPNFSSLDKFSVVEALSKVPTTIICGTDDRLTSIEHSRKLHEHIGWSTLIECEGAGHMVIMERHEQVNAALDQLIATSSEAGTG